MFNMVLGELINKKYYILYDLTLPVCVFLFLAQANFLSQDLLF